MIPTISRFAAILCFVAISSTASAGVYTDDLSRCFVKSTTAADQTRLVQWVFAALSLNPAISSYTSVTPAQRAELNHGYVTLLERLLFIDCHQEAVNAMKYEGAGSLDGAMQTLGEVAGRGLMSDPSVLAGMRDFAKYMDKAKWDDLNKEAGVPTVPYAVPAK
jgi:hypothetical protein